MKIQNVIRMAFIDLYQVSFDEHWLSQARLIVDYVLAHFRDDQGGLFFSAQTARKILSQGKWNCTTSIYPLHILF